MVPVETLRGQLARIPFAHAAGLRVVTVSAAEAVLTLPLTPAVTAAAGPARMDEGMVAMAADQAASLAIWGALGFPLPQATLSLSLSYLAGLREGALMVRASLTGRAGPHAVLEVAAATEAGEVVARGGADFFLGRFPGSTGEADGAFPRETVPPAAPLAGENVRAALGLRGGALPWGTHLQGSSHPVALHGGAIATAAGLVAADALGGAPLRLARADTAYLRGGLPRLTVFRPEVVARTRQTALVRVDTMQDGGARHVATSLFRFCAA